MHILAVCDNSSMLNTILFIKNIMKIIFVVVPIVLALLFSIDLAKNVFAKDDKDNLKLGIKRIVYSIVLMFVPLIVETFMGMISDYSKVAKCYDIATEQKVKDLQKKEEAEYEKQKEEIRKAQEEQKQNIDKEKKEEEKARKDQEEKARQSAANKEKENSNVSSKYPDIANITKYTKSNGKVAQATSAGGRYDKKDGDESGNEVSKNKGVPKHATYIVRFNDPKKSEIAARCAEAGADNDNIGYSVNDYTSLYREAKKVKWDLSKIKKKCTTVCSAFASVCINATGTKITKHLNGFGNNESRFRNISAFKVIKPYSKNKLMRGDIIVHECPGQCGHMSIAR